MTTKFDPAAWLAKAEAVGYEIYLTSPDRGVAVIEPEAAAQISTDEEIALWGEYRPKDTATRMKNSRALKQFLKESGRIVGPEPEWVVS